MANAKDVSFEHPDLAAELEKLTPEEIDALSFGAIRLDETGKITLYSARERLDSGYRLEAVNRLYFADVAPCLDTTAFRGRIENARKSGRLSIDVTQFVDLPGGQKDVEVRMRVQSAPSGATWILTQRLS